jgi:hypothetical protein
MLWHRGLAVVERKVKLRKSREMEQSKLKLDSMFTEEPNILRPVYFLTRIYGVGLGRQLSP